MENSIKHKEGKLPYEIDWAFIKQVAERMHSNKCNGKYLRDNWKKPMSIIEIEDAISRHFTEVLLRNYEDDGRKFGHIEGLVTNLMILNYQLNNFSDIKINN